MNLQELFNIVWERAKDKRKARAAEGEPAFCMYRLGENPEGLPCFIGAAIPNEKYASWMDTSAAPGVLRRVLTVIDFDLSMYSAARELQGIHDGRSPEEWNHFLRAFAEEYRLHIPEDKAP